MTFWKPRTCRPTGLRILTAAVAATVVSACGEGPVSPAAPDLGVGSALYAKATQVGVCHRTGGGAYELLTINGNALPAHLAHGDAAPGAAVPDGSGATFDAGCVPRTEDVTGTYVLETVGGQPVPALGTGELLHSMTIVLEEGGSCSFGGEVQGAQEDPAGEVVTFAFASCEYSLDGTELTLVLVDEGEEDSMTAHLSDGRIVLQILIWDDADETDEGVMGDAVFVKA